jgi:hypothetical protein
MALTGLGLAFPERHRKNLDETGELPAQFFRIRMNWRIQLWVQKKGLLPEGNL